MEKIHPRKRILKKYSEDNTAKQFVSVCDPKQDYIVEQYEKPEQLNDITTTCNVSPSPEYPQPSSPKNTGQRQLPYYKSDLSDMNNINYVIPHLPNLEVTKVEDNACPYELSIFPDNTEVRKSSLCSDQSAVLRVVGKSSTFSSHHDTLSQYKTGQHDNTCLKGVETIRKSVKSKHESTSKNRGTSISKSETEERSKRKSRKTKQPIIPKDIEPILTSAGIDEKIAKRLLVESDKEQFQEQIEHIQGKVGCMIGNSNFDIRMVLKDIRRKGKNKNSAAISRHKKISRIQELREVKQQKEKELNVKNWYSSKNLKLQEVKKNLEEKLAQQRSVKYKDMNHDSVYVTHTIVFH